MRIETEIINNYHVKYRLEKIASWDKILFLDIETTGFSAANSYLYLIGCIYFKEGSFHVIQWLAESYEEEKEILSAFFQFAADFTHLAHYNGNNFDLPFMVQKCAQYGLPFSFAPFEGLDIYRRVTPYRSLLGLPNCKQRTVEQFLKIKRSDLYNGGDLISIYHDYVAAPSIEGRYLLLMHNVSDLKGMLEILPILAYHDLFNGPLKAKKVQANYYPDSNGYGHNMLYMKLRLPSALPAPLSFNYDHLFFKGDGEEGYLAVPIYEEELKYFYANYQDYYYLPTEDCALHKSIASYVDKEFRRQATAATCYSRKSAAFLPQWEILVEPFFKRDYADRLSFFEITDDIKKNRLLFSEYAQHILGIIKKGQAGNHPTKGQ
ncbi:MAG: ribonuclease H-like domain-containing protein [Lachnospiraceae bacterium]|nr:ribonuclease H-like domain-containing protein [Lachnospiraceae bacterium]